MKKQIFIIISSIIVIILLAVWIYLMFFKESNNNQDTFTNLDLPNPPDVTTGTNPPKDTPVVDVSGKEVLRQLTSGPVVGYNEITNSLLENPMVYYVQAGTGHIYSIDLNSGEEERISATTIPMAKRAAITPNGKFVMLTSGQNGTNETVFGVISSTTPETITTPIEGKVIDFVATADNNFLYALQNRSSVTIKEFLADSKTSRTVFTIPFREATIRWGKTAADKHYVYPKPNPLLEGYLYEVNNSRLGRLPVSGYGLIAFGDSKNNIIYTKMVNGKTDTYLHSNTTGNDGVFSLDLIPDKCTRLASSSICAGAINIFDTSNTPDRWYKGEVIENDQLWEVDLESGIATKLADPELLTGRQLDITDLMPSRDEKDILFRNKTDNTLWLYEYK